jgi:uncharacterized membrane protein
VWEDGDRHWLAGTTYHNPKDRRLLVPKRLGLGLGRTLNLGHPVAWLVLMAPVVVGFLAALARR